jgi:hypothetical protein
MSSSAVNRRPLDFCLHRHPISVNCLYHARMVLSVGGSFAYFARNAYCTVTTDLLVWYSNTENNFSPGAAIFSLHTLASSSGRNVNYDEKQGTGKPFFSCSFYLYRFRKYVSCGFPIINFCNPGVHHETSCTLQFDWMRENRRRGWDQQRDNICQALNVPGSVRASRLSTDGEWQFQPFSYQCRSLQPCSVTLWH